MYECGIRPLWSGFARGLAFRREFEDRLSETTLRRLERDPSNNQPIIVHGPTGTGKTVAMGSLAYGVASSRKYPVIFIERRIQRPVHPDIDQCCQWFEDHGADGTLIVWDGMTDQSNYFELQGYLASRGRKAVVVGSSYKLDNAVGENLVEVPGALNAAEASAFADFLRALGVEITTLHRDALNNRDPSYLVALYRLLPPARPRITTGVVQELELLEAELVSAVNETASTNQPLSALAHAFLTAGIIDSTRLQELQQQTGLRMSLSDVTDLVDTVTVPGRHGLAIPIELLARACGLTDFADLAQILNGFDLIHASEDSSGRIVVGPRHSLEAELIVRSRLPNISDEVGIVSRIIQAIRSYRWPNESDEIDFVIDFLQEIGPRAGDNSRFASVFRDLANAISKLRETRNVRNPRLMLQEAYLLREWVAIKSRHHERPQDARAVLDEAQAILEEAMDMLDGSRRHHRLRTFIATELASTFGTATIDALENEEPTGEDIKLNFDRLLDAVGTARTLDFSAYNPVDILAWSTIRLAQSKIVDGGTRTEAIVDVLDALETVDKDLLETHNASRLEGRKFEVSTLIGDEELSETAFKNLLEMNSAAGLLHTRQGYKRRAKNSALDSPG